MTKTIEQVTVNPKQILTVEQLSSMYPVFSISTIRWYIHCSKPRYSSVGKVPANGFADCMIRVGRRIYIDESKFITWLQLQNKLQESNNP